MSDGQTTEAVLRLVVQGQEQLDAAVKLMRDLQNESGNFSRTTEKTIKDTEGLGAAMGTLRNQLEGVQKGLAGSGATANSTAQSWTDLRAKVEGAAAAYRAFNQEQVAAGLNRVSPEQFFNSPKNTTGATLADVAAYKNGASANLIGDQTYQDGLRAKSLQQQLVDIQTESAAQKKTYDTNQAYLASLQAKSLQQQLVDIQTVAAAARRADEERAAANQRRAIAQNAANASNYSVARPGSIFAQGQIYDSGASLAASETSWAKQAAAAEAATSKLAGSLPRLRYALYDVATTATTTGLVVGALGAYAIKASTDFDRAFADVRRTMDDISDGAALKLKNQLIELTRTVPLSFQEIAKIATLGNQLGVSQQDLVSFTETIAKFSTVSGISAEESAKAFGTLGSLLDFTPEQYGHIAGAVELVGRSSAATDADILTMTKDIAQQAHQAGFTAEQVIALAGATAQLRIAPERARGAYTLFFQTLDKAVAQGGKQLQEFSLITGLLPKQLSEMVKSGQGLEVFQSFLKGLANKDNIVQTTNALIDLKLSQRGVSDVFERLASNSQIFTQYLGLAQDKTKVDAELNRQLAIVLDTVASKWQEFLNAIKEFAATAGTTLGPAVGNILTDLTRFVNMLTDFAKTPFGSSVVELTGIILGLTAVLLGGAGAAAVAAGSFLAIRTALGLLGGSAAGAAAGLDVTAGSLVATGVAAEGASVGVRIFRAALVSTGVGAIIVALGYLILLLVDFGGAMRMVQPEVTWFVTACGIMAQAVTGVTASFLNMESTILSALGNLPGVGGIFKDWAHGLKEAGAQWSGISNIIPSVLNDWTKGYNAWVDSLDKTPSTVSGAAKSVQAYGGNVDALNKKLYDNLNASNQAVNGTNNVANSAKSASDQVRTLVDYANDLSGVFTRSFDLRFGGQQGMDRITTSWQTMRQNIDDARKSLDQLRASQAQLLADKAVKEYWLTVANSYGDTARATSLKADIGSDNSKITDGNAQIADAQAKMSTALTGNSKAAIDNRNNILGLVGSYEDLIKQYASSGLTQDQLKVKVGQLKQQFVEQATQLGFSRGDVEKYTGAFDDMSLAIARVPRNITVTANTNPALQALAEFQDKLKAAAKGVKVPITATVNNDSLAKFARGQGIVAQISSLQGALLPSASTDSQISRNQAIQAQIDALTRKINSGNYYTGGYTGNGGVYDAAGIVHGQEFVFDAVATNFYTPTQLNRMMQFAHGGGSPSGAGAGGTVSLDNGTIYRLADAIARRMPNLSITADAIGSASRLSAMAGNALGRY